MLMQDIVNNKEQIKYLNYLTAKHPNLVDCQLIKNGNETILKYQLEELTNIEQSKLACNMLLLKILYALKELPPEIQTEITPNNIYIDHAQNIKFLRRRITTSKTNNLLKIKKLAIQLKIDNKTKKKISKALTIEKIQLILLKSTQKQSSKKKPKQKILPLTIFVTITASLLLVIANLKLQITAVNNYQTQNYPSCRQKLKQALVTDQVMKLMYSICITKSQQNIYPQELIETISKKQYIPQLIIALENEKHKNVDQYLQLINDEEITNQFKKIEINILNQKSQLSKKQTRRLNELKNDKN